MPEKLTDPVRPDQGGRSMPIDPVHQLSPCRDELVRVKAYEIYEQSGRQQGRDLEHWLAAEDALEQPEFEETV